MTTARASVLPSIAEIKAAVAEEYGVTVLDIESDRRARECAWPRQTAMWLARRATARSLPDIGRFFGGRDHTTVIFAIRAVEKRRVHPEEFERTERLLVRLGGKAPAAVKTDRMRTALREVETLTREVDAIQKRLRRLALVLEEEIE